jgi:hypothetical protein
MATWTNVLYFSSRQQTMRKIGHRHRPRHCLSCPFLLPSLFIVFVLVAQHMTGDNVNLSSKFDGKMIFADLQISDDIHIAITNSTVKGEKLTSPWIQATTGCPPQSSPFLLPSSSDRNILNVSKSLYERIDKSELEAINCTPSTMTQSVQLIPGCPHWELQTYDTHGNQKSVGGDEFYIFYTDDAGAAAAAAAAAKIHNSPSSVNIVTSQQPPHERHHQHQQQQQQQDRPTAVAQITDLQNGRYRLEFVASPLNARLHRMVGHGSVTVYFQYTCGIGKLHPPVKNDTIKWKDGGSTVVKYVKQSVAIPPIRPFHPPSVSSHNVDLSNYTIVIPLGDSLMQQFTKPLQLFPPNMQTPLNDETVKTWIHRIQNGRWWRQQFGLAAQMHQRRMMQQKSTNKTHIINHSTDNQKFGAILIGSHAWDLLALVGFKGGQSHADSLVTLVKFLQKEYPYMDVILKAPFAMHIHIPMSKDRTEMMRLGSKINKRWGGDDPVKRLKDGVKYMSESRVRYVGKKVVDSIMFSSL